MVSKRVEMPTQVVTSTYKIQCWCTRKCCHKSMSKMPTRIVMNVSCNLLIGTYLFTAWEQAMILAIGHSRLMPFLGGNSSSEFTTFAESDDQMIRTHLPCISNPSAESGVSLSMDDQAFEASKPLLL